MQISGGANMQCTGLENASFKNAIFNDATIWPVNFNALEKEPLKQLTDHSDTTKMKTIKTSDLKIEQIPLPNDRISLIDAFAITFDIYESNAKMPSLSIDDNFDQLSIKELRFILYSEQRRWNHFGRDYDPHTEKRIRLLISILRSKLQN